MRLENVWTVSMDQNNAFPDQHMLQLGIRSGYLTVVSRVPCARGLRCVARQEAEDSSMNDVFSSNNSREVFSGF